MEIFFSEFKLESEMFWNNQTSSKFRDGVLLKFQFDKNLVGYSCYNPWPELGDETWQIGLQQFKKGQNNSLLAQACYWADVDARARAEKICLRETIKPLKNHFLVQELKKDLVLPKDFSFLKVKMGRHLGKETELLKDFTNYCLRLDFNGKLSFQEFNAWWSSLPHSIKEVVDFIEDPFDPSTASEKDLNNSLWAWDFHKDKISNPQTIVVKPTRSLKSYSNKPRRIFTHSFDHPLGVVISHYAASQELRSEQEIHGLLYRGVKSSDHSEKDFTYEQNKMMINKTGTGFGFDDLLEACDWTKL